MRVESMGYMEEDEGSEGEGGDFSLEEGGHGNKAELRKSNKPIMEKRRRARINNCLNELKGILLEAMRKDPARHSKLEKADILELTVRHLQNVQRNQLAMAMATDPTVLHRFKNGFSECATEVNRYLGRLEGVEHGIQQRLTGHLGSCVNGLDQVGPGSFNGYSTRYSSLAMPFSIPPSPVTPGDFNNNRPILRLESTPCTVTSSNFEQLNLNQFNQRLEAVNIFSPVKQRRLPTPPPSPPPPSSRVKEIGQGRVAGGTPLDFSLGRAEREERSGHKSQGDSMWRPW